MNELGSLSQCMMDGDAENLGRARSIRRKALLASSVLEFGLIAALLVWPLITPGVISNRVVVMPLPPYHGLPQMQPVAPHPSAAQPPPNAFTRIWNYASPVTRAARSASETNNPEPPGLYDPLETGNDGFSGSAIPGGGDKGPIVLAPPHASASATRPVRVSSGVMEAALSYRVEPVYPTIARAIHLEGAVHLRAIIKTDGTVGELTLLDGNPILAQAAKAAVREWRYKPTQLSGQPVEVETIITVNFVLE